MKRSALFLLFLTLSCRPLFSADPSPSLLRASDDFSRVAAQVNPSVVNIATTQIVQQRYPQFWSDFFNEEFMDQGRSFRRQSLGSGIILDAEGRILTNWHVVNGADEISVRLDNGDLYPAKVLGEDEGVDLAVLKIEPKQPLSPAKLGDSDKVRIGDWAIAIGNPFGFDHSLTVGVISAKERSNVFSGTKAHYQNFLQTDASINQGNSGGPLCNIRGEVIGINTAISTPNQGSIGIGFAIPINMVRRAIPDLVHSGRVIPPRLGFYTQDIDASLATAMKLGSATGVLVTDVAAGSVAEKAGLKRGDVVAQVNGKNAGNATELKSRLYEANPGEPMLLNVLRKGQALAIRIEPGQLTPAAELNAWHGIEVGENSAEKARAQGLATAQGVLVVKVLKNSSADQIGVMPGDLLLEINQQPIGNLAGWKKVTRQLEDSEDAILRIARGPASAYVVLPGEK